MKVENLDLILISLLFSIIYIKIVRKILIKSFLDKFPNNKIKKNAILSLIIVIVGFVLIFKVFNTNTQHSLIARYTLFFGNSFIFLNSVLFHWSDFKYNTKVIIIGSVLFIKIILLSTIKNINMKITYY